MTEMRLLCNKKKENFCRYIINHNLITRLQIFMNLWEMLRYKNAQNAHNIHKNMYMK